MLAAVTLGAIVVWLAAWNYPHFDTYVHLTWGRDLLDGNEPGYTDFVAPTPHPLWLAVCTLVAAVAGGGADHGMMLVALLSWVAMLAAIYRIGAATTSAPIGLLAAAFVGSSATFFFFTTRAYVDIPFVALVLWAAALEAGRPRRGWRVMALLALAGLLRPEAWLLAGMYFLWIAYGLRDVRRLLPLAALAAAAPVTWALIDLAVTGDALYSLHRTQAGAEGLNRTRGVEHVPGSLWSFFGSIIRPPVAAVGVVGVVGALVLLGARRVAPQLAILVFGVVAFFGIGVAQLSILPRYVILPSAALALFAAFALLGWTTLPDEHRLRRNWRIGSLAALAAGAVGLAVFGLNTAQFTDRFSYERGVHRDLERLLAAPAVRDCGRPVTLPGFRLVPDVRWILDARSEDVGARAERRRATGVEIVVRDPAALHQFVLQDGHAPQLNLPGPGFRPLAESGRFAAYGKCEGPGGA